MSKNISQHEFQAIISLESPLEDYNKLIEQKLKGITFEVQQQIFDRIAAKMRETIWKLLFAYANPKTENLDKAIKCLHEYKMDSCKYAHWEYNDWIPKLRDELLNRKMFYFWWYKVVKCDMGLCYGEDSNYFDVDDEQAAEFYKFDGCVAPFNREYSSSSEEDTDTDTDTDDD